MHATRTRFIRRLVLPTLAFTALNVPVHPATAAPIREAVFDARVTAPATLRLPIRANMVAVSVPADADETEVEVRTPDGRWVELHFEDDHYPDPAETVRVPNRIFSEPVWVGTVDRLRIRLVDQQRADLRFHVINSLGDASLAPTPLRWLGTVWHALTVPRHASAIVPDQPIVTRKQWGANESWVNGRPAPVSTIRIIFVHHTVNSNSYSRAQAPALVRSIYRYHTKTQGWSDLGYNFLVDRFGTVYEGRGGGIDNAVPGAHARGANTGSSGIALIGDFSRAGPSKAMRRALARLVAWKADVHHIPVVGTKALSGKKYRRLSGHRDANPTACPGNAAYNLLPWTRRAALNYWLPKIYEVRAPSSVLRRDGDNNQEEWRVLAWGSSPLTWKLSITDGSGKIVHERSFKGKKLVTGSRNGLFWDGLGKGNTPVPSGRYLWSLEARDGGKSARGKSGSISVINDHFRGTLLRDTAGTYVLSRNSVGATGAERLTDLAAKTRFRARAPIQTGPDERGRYPSIATLGLRLGALLRENGELLVVTGQSQVSSLAPGVAAALGYKASAAIPVSTAELAETTRGAMITNTSRHPVGTYVSVATATGTDYFRVRSVDRVPVRPISVTGQGIAAEVVPATAGDLALPAIATPENAPDGALVHVPNGTRWFLVDDTRRKVVDKGLFAAYGYDWDSAILVNASDISHLPVGSRIE